MKVNSNFFTLKEPVSVYDFLIQSGYKIDRIAVELNGEIVPKKSFGEVMLTDADTLEIVCFVGGG